MHIFKETSTSGGIWAIGERRQSLKSDILLLST